MTGMTGISVSLNGPGTPILVIGCTKLFVRRRGDGEEMGHFEDSWSRPRPLLVSAAKVDAVLLDLVTSPHLAGLPEWIDQSLFPSFEASQ